MQNLQDHPLPESSIAASTASRNAAGAARSPILALPVEIRQMIYGYLLPYGERFCLLPQGHADVAKLVERLGSSINLNDFIKQEGSVKVPLLQVCRQFSAEALPMLIRQNTIIILVLEDEHLEHTCLSCMDPPYWPYVRNLEIKILAHSRTLVFPDYGPRRYHRDDIMSNDLFRKRTILPPIDNDLWTVDNARGVAQLLHDQPSTLHITVQVVLEIQWSLSSRPLDLWCTVCDCLRHYLKPFLQLKLCQLSLVHATIWPPSPDYFRAGPRKGEFGLDDFLATGKMDPRSGDLDMDFIPWSLLAFSQWLCRHGSTDPSCPSSEACLVRPARLIQR